jgi:hypothetical protein
VVIDILPDASGTVCCRAEPAFTLFESARVSADQHLGALPHAVLMAEHLAVLTDLSRIEFYLYRDDDVGTDESWLVAIALQFQGALLVVEVNPDTDEADLQVGDAALRYWTTNSVARNVTAQPEWSGLIGANCVWWWRLTNQQGYADGVQIEFTKNATNTTRQWIAAASRLSSASIVHAS